MLEYIRVKRSLSNTIESNWSTMTKMDFFSWQQPTQYTSRLFYSENGILYTWQEESKQKGPNVTRPCHTPPIRTASTPRHHAVNDSAHFACLSFFRLSLGPRPLKPTDFLLSLQAPSSTVTVRTLSRWLPTSVHRLRPFIFAPPPPFPKLSES